MKDLEQIISVLSKEEIRFYKLFINQTNSSKNKQHKDEELFDFIRKGKNKVKAVLYDISDDCTYNSRKNYTLNHVIERIKIYNEENFNYEIITVQLKT